MRVYRIVALVLGAADTAGPSSFVFLRTAFLRV
jgi:hypothetical protein